MALIVQKFGGTAVADAERIHAVAGIIANTAAAGNQVVAVLSAQGHTTDELVGRAAQIDPNYPLRELDMLLSAGEQMSVSLCAAALLRMGCDAVSLTGWQAGLTTDSCHGNAAVTGLSSDRIRRELDAGRIVLVAGFQGVDALGDITTLGRGGSDTTAVALAVLLHADACVIYTDVDGVYSADPRKEPNAVKYSRLSYETMLSLIERGAEVLHDRCVLLAQKHGIPIEVRSAFCDCPGTIVAGE